MSTRRGFIIVLLFTMSVVTASAQEGAGTVSGRIVSSRDSQPLALVQVELTGTTFVAVTGDDGAFQFAGVPPGSYVLHTAIVGYGPIREEFALAAGEVKRFDVVLISSTVRVSETAVVTADAFARTEETSPAEFTIAGDERKNLASVLADDPLRAVQSLPGVTSNDDFSSQFSIRGAPFSRVGLYLDGVLLHSPFHSTDGQADDGSLTIFSGDLADDITLYQGAWPVKYADRTAGILSVDTRPGSRDKITGEVTASASNAGVVVEGPLNKGRRGSWLLGIRKSYLQYILNRIDFGDQAPLAFGFTDSQGRLDYDLTAHHALSVTFLDGSSSVDRTRYRSELSPSTVMTSAFHFAMVNVGERYASEHLLVTNRIAWSRETGNVANRDADPLSDQTYIDWTARSDARFVFSPLSTFEFGGEFRHMRQDGSETHVLYAPGLTSIGDVFDGAAHEAGAYAQESVRIARMRVTAGARLETFVPASREVATPYVGVTLQPTSRTRLQFDWGRYAQFPELNQLFSGFGGINLLPERASHYEAAVEESLNDRTRVRLEFYDREDHDQLARPALEPRLSPGGAIVQAVPEAAWLNSQRGYARGVQVFLQRRTENGFTGWASCAYGRTLITDDELQTSFPADYDQRYTVNAYLSRRIRPTVNVSGKFTYGSGMPLPGFYRSVPGGYELDESRNMARAPAYQRTDLRLNKAYVHQKLTTTLYAEVVNVTNHTNRDFDSPGPYDPGSGRVRPNFYSMFPILPSAGLAIAF